MNADLNDPHWLYVWPAYALAATALVALAVSGALRLHRWARRAKALDDGEAR
ncbi:MAG: heme exporter protein CcmD [Hyphomonadaceae bacterium]|nr:heme exporter protein CcmD [Hyphomonadaceae bacterium]